MTSETQPGQVDDDDLDSYRTDAQREWREWATHGYRKLYQPRPMLWAGGIFFGLFTVGLLTVFWLASTALAMRMCAVRWSRTACAEVVAPAPGGIGRNGVVFPYESPRKDRQVVGDREEEALAASLTP